MNAATAGEAGVSRRLAAHSRLKVFGALEQEVARGIVRGWIAGDAADGVPLEVEFLIGTQLIGRCTPDEPTTQCLSNDDRPVRGFSFAIPEQYRLRHLALHLVARIANDEVELMGSPLALPPCPEFVGAVQTLKSTAIEGWALDILRPARPVVVIAVQEGAIRAIASTQSGLETLSRHGISGDFRFRIPFLAKGNEEFSRIQIFVANTNMRLGWETGFTPDLSNSKTSSEPFKFLLD